MSYNEDTASSIKSVKINIVNGPTGVKCHMWGRRFNDLCEHFATSLDCDTYDTTCQSFGNHIITYHLKDGLTQRGQDLLDSFAKYEHENVEHELLY